MGFKVRSEFWENVKRVAQQHKEKCKKDPILRAEHEKVVKQRECRKTHKKWLEDRDVHGSLGWYCARCGAWDSYYYFLQYQRESFMSCDEILAEK